MRHVKLLGAAIFAVLALGVMVAPMASAAEPEAVVLAGEGFPVTFEGTSGAGKLETLGGGTKVECAKGTVTGSVESAKKGKAEFTFKECKSSGFKCNTVKAAEGTIITTGTFVPVYDNEAPLLPALLLTVAETKFECTSLVKVTVKGNLLLLFASLTSGTEVKEAELILKQTSGDPADKTYRLKSGEATKEALLLSSINGGTFVDSADGSEANKVKYAKMLGLTF